MKTFQTTRVIPASVQDVFAAFSDPHRLARWWGPKGFTNTFNVCEFKTNGRWSFVMHGPDGANYPNDSIFADVTPPTKVVVRHDSEPKFLLTITLQPSGKHTHLTWSQAFENESVAENIKHIVVPANEQNLDRLVAEVIQ